MNHWIIMARMVVTVEASSAHVIELSQLRPRLTSTLTVLDQRYESLQASKSDLFHKPHKLCSENSSNSSGRCARVATTWITSWSTVISALQPRFTHKIQLYAHSTPPFSSPSLTCASTIQEMATSRWCFRYSPSSSAYRETLQDSTILLHLSRSSVRVETLIQGNTCANLTVHAQSSYSNT